MLAGRPFTRPRAERRVGDGLREPGYEMSPANEHLKAEPGRQGQPRRESRPASPARAAAWTGGKPLSADAVVYLQRTAGNLAVSRLIDPVGDDWGLWDSPPTAAQSVPAVDESQIIEIETASMADTLKSFREITVYVKGPAEMKPAKAPGISDEIAGAPGLNFDLPHYPLKDVTVHAAYFINRPASQTAYHSGDAFAKVVTALREKSLIESGGAKYRQGQAVKMGKS